MPNHNAGYQKGKTNKLMWFFVILIIAVVLFSLAAVSNGFVDNSKQQLDKNFKSSVSYQVIFRVESSNYHYVQQTEGKVTPDSAEQIIKELYSKQVSEDPERKLGNVLIFDSNVKLTPGSKKGTEAEESAEYDSRSNTIVINGESYPFEPAK